MNNDYKIYFDKALERTKKYNVLLSNHMKVDAVDRILDDETNLKLECRIPKTNYIV